MTGGIGVQTARVRMAEDEGVGAVADEDDVGPLLLRHAEGDLAAFPAVVARYRRPVYSYLVRCGVSPDDRDDLFQSIFLRLHRACGQFQRGRPAHPWIFTIVANQVRSHMRRRRVWEVVVGSTPAEPVDGAPDVHRAAVARETVAWLERELTRLPLPQREALVLAGVEGRPLHEVAQVLGRPLNTVKTHLRRARRALAEKLARRQAAGLDEEER